MTDDEKREKLVKLLVEKNQPGTDPIYIVKAASVLYQYIYANKIEPIVALKKDNLPF